MVLQLVMLYVCLLSFWLSEEFMFVGKSRVMFLVVVFCCSDFLNGGHSLGARGSASLFGLGILCTLFKLASRFVRCLS